MNNNLILKREITAGLMVINYLIFRIVNIFITNSAITYILIIAFLILCILISFRIPREYKGEQLVHIGLSFILFSSYLPPLTDVITFSIGFVLAIIGGRLRYIRLGKSIKQVYNWYL